MAKKLADGIRVLVSGLFSCVVTCLCVFYLFFFDTWPVTLLFIALTLVGAFAVAKMIDKRYKSTMNKRN